MLWWCWWRGQADAGLGALRSPAVRECNFRVFAVGGYSLLALHSCDDEYAVHVFVKVALCNSRRLWSYTRSRVVVLCSGRCLVASRSR